MYVFGSQYLRGYTPEKDQWEKDMENMKKSGFNTIRAWFLWNAIEKSEGNFDYDYISDFLTLAGKYDLQVGILFHLHSCPAWAVKKFSKYFYVNEDNLPFEPATRPNTPSSGWPGLCYDHEEVRELEYNFISSVMKETKKHSSVAFYEPMNEPHQWNDHMNHKIFCYCPASAEKFRQWLRNKYHDIQSLNDAWGRFYGSFDEVRPPRWARSYSDFIDFRLFNMDNLAEELTFRTNIIREFDIKPVIAHSYGGGTVSSVSLGPMAFDDWKNAAIFDKWGFSAFPTVTSSGSLLGLGSNAARCAANGKDFWQSELSSGETGDIFHQLRRFNEKEFDKFSLESIRHGAKGLLYWQYRKERIGGELGGFGMTDFDGGPTKITKKASELGKMLTENEDVLLNGKIKEAEVGIVLSIRSYLANWALELKNCKDSVDSLSGYFSILWEENIVTDIIHEDFAENLSRYKIIILPSAIAISPEFAEKLKVYVENGGTLLSEQAFSIFDPTFKLSYTVPGYGFDKIFGANQDDFAIRNSVTLTKGNETINLNGNLHAETYKNVTAESLYDYEDGTPAILSNNYGKGTAILTGVNLGFMCSDRQLVSDDDLSTDASNKNIDAKKIILDICYKAGVSKNICSAEDVKVSVIETDTDCIIMMINSSSQNKSGEIKLSKNYTVSNVIYSSADVSLKGNILNFTLEADASAVIRLK